MKLILILVMIIFAWIILVTALFSPATISNEKILSGLEQITNTNAQKTYTINLRFFEEDDISFVTFYVTDNEDNVIFEADDQWRVYDFHNIVFDRDDNIIITTGDIGEQIYLYKSGERRWEISPEDQSD